MLITESQIRHLIQSKLIKTLLKEGEENSVIVGRSNNNIASNTDAIKKATESAGEQEAIVAKNAEQGNEQPTELKSPPLRQKFEKVWDMTSQVIEKVSMPVQNEWNIFQKSIEKIFPPDRSTEGNKDGEKVKEEVVNQSKNIDPSALQPSVDFKCWFRFPQLNGGYFEMAKILMDKSLIDKLHDTGRKTKQYEKAGQIYGLLKANGDKADDPQITGITRFFSDPVLCKIYIYLFLAQHVGFLDLCKNLLDIQTISSKIVGQHKFVGKCLDEFFKNHMMKVGEYYFIDHNLLSFIILKAIAVSKSRLGEDEGIQKYAASLQGHKPKIIKAKFSPADLKKVTSGGGSSDLDTLNVDPKNQKNAQGGYTIKNMFDDRAKDDFEKGEYQQSDKNLQRAAREKIYK